MSREERFIELLSHNELPNNITVIKTSDVWCDSLVKSNTKPCGVAENNEVYMADEDHLSIKGAEIFGKSLISHSPLASLFAK